MKAIKITEQLKSQNKQFKSLTIGEWYKVQLPDVFMFEDWKYMNYKDRTDLHEEHGFVNFENPVYDNKTEKLGELYLKENGKVTHYVLDKTPEELDALIASQVPTLYFNLKLLELGVTEQNVIDTIKYAHNNGLLSADVNESLKIKDALILKWTKSNVIERDFPELYSLIPLVNQVAGSNLTQEQIKKIFVDYDE